MKSINLNLLLILLLFLSSCKDTNSDISNEPIDKEIKVQSKLSVNFSIGDCIHNALYYLDNTDIKTYDSLDTRYFHEILGYASKEAIGMEEKIISLKQNISLDTNNMISSIIKDEMQLQIDSLRNELNYYDKEVIGYVFVHTYTSHNDTLSAIIVMNKDCASSHAIPVKTINNINPDDYVYRVTQVDDKNL